MRIHAALDSGAHSLFNRHAAEGVKRKRNVANADYSFFDTEEFQTYLDKYAAYCRAHGDHFTFYVTVDVIFNAERSWDTFDYLWKSGLRPLPVLHHGEPIEFLKKMLRRTDYVGVGGLAQGATQRAYMTWADEVFAYLGKTSEVKVHGFAMTSVPLVRKYKWYSVDSTTPWSLSRNGSLLLPSIRNNLASYTSSHILPVGSATKRNSHANTLGETQLDQANTYLSSRFGLTLEEVTEHYYNRDLVNIYHFIKLFAELGVVYYVSGRAGAHMDNLYWLLSQLTRLGIKDFHYLGTYFDLPPLRRVLAYAKDPKPRQTRPAIARVHSRPDPFLFHQRSRVRIRR